MSKKLGESLTLKGPLIMMSWYALISLFLRKAIPSIAKIVY
jgi:hypothetical protein